MPARLPGATAGNGFDLSESRQGGDLTEPKHARFSRGLRVANAVPTREVVQDREGGLGLRPRDEDVVVAPAGENVAADLGLRERGGERRREPDCIQ